MPRKNFTKAERDMAAVICDASASDGQRVYADIYRMVGATKPSLDLARAAWDALWSRAGSPYQLNWTPELDAEAAQLLRDGWSPGDPVERR